MTKFFVGQEGVKIKEGHPVRILCVDAPGEYPIIGYIIAQDGAAVLVDWTKEGFCRLEYHSSGSLVPPKKIRKVWLNRYWSYTCSYESQQEVERNVYPDFLKTACLVEVEI